MRFYVGNAREETIQKYTNDSIGGFCEGEEWAVFVDNIAKNQYEEKKIRKLESVWGSVPPKNMCVSEILECIRSVKVNEDELIENIVKRINECVLYTLGIHWAGNLPDIYEIPYIYLKGNLSGIFNLIHKYRLRPKGIELLGKEEMLLHLGKREDENIKKFLDELKSRNLKFYVKREWKKYPIEFELDDIKITNPELQKQKVSE